MLYPTHMGNKHDDQTKAAYEKTITTFVEHLNKKLVKSGKSFMCGDKMTIGDFTVASIVFSFIENATLGGGSDYPDKGKAIIQANPAFCAYVDRLKTELSSYLTNRGEAAF